MSEIQENNIQNQPYIKNDMVIVGLTGPTGAGKTEVAKVLSQQGFAHIDADQLSRELATPNSKYINLLVEEYSSDILNSDGTLNRKKLANIAFATPQSTQRLNEITHPLILELTIKKLNEFAKKGYKIAFFDAPLLFESKADEMCDITVAVLAPKNVRIKRIIKRDNISTQHAKKRMKAQPNDDFYKQKAKIVMDGSVSLQQLKEDSVKLAGCIREGNYD